MKIISKFLVFALTCISICFLSSCASTKSGTKDSTIRTQETSNINNSSGTTTNNQECNNYLQLASEMVSQKKYCNAKLNYQKYSKCNNNADVSTEIAMCDRFCKINVMEGEEIETVSTTEQINITSSTKHDIITLLNGDDIHAIVQEIGDTYVKYKRIDNPNGANHTIKKSDVFMIMYANGSKDVFNQIK